MTCGRVGSFLLLLLRAVAWVVSARIEGGFSRVPRLGGSLAMAQTGRGGHAGKEVLKAVPASHSGWARDA